MLNLEIKIRAMEDGVENGENKAPTAASSNPSLQVSVSFGRFGSDSLSWEKFSAFPPSKYLEEAERYATPGSVAMKRAYFEAHYKKIAENKHEFIDHGKQVDKTASITPEVQKSGDSGCEARDFLPEFINGGSNDEPNEELVIVTECLTLVDGMKETEVKPEEEEAREASMKEMKKENDNHLTKTNGGIKRISRDRGSRKTHQVNKKTLESKERSVTMATKKPTPSVSKGGFSSMPHSSVNKGKASSLSSKPLPISLKERTRTMERRGDKASVSSRGFKAFQKSRNQSNMAPEICM